MSINVYRIDSDRKSLANRIYRKKDKEAICYEMAKLYEIANKTKDLETRDELREVLSRVLW